ncbi:hypothetical protein BDY24DRAFT_376549 [Mrakia frigida]|uniref:Mco6p n=1 Tax=Mrakia frigida TaxID=29902 RepID=UPI003FCBF61D
MPLPNLRAIFASARTTEEETRLSQQAFAKFAAFAVSCLAISLIANSRTVRNLS